jgi:DNA polymerase-4
VRLSVHQRAQTTARAGTDPTNLPDGQHRRVILHSDMNHFYAAVECLRRPEVRNRPMVVGGDEELRHGIVLAKNPLANKLGITTAMTLVEARQRCPELVVVPPDHQRYQHYSRKAREIYYRFTDLVEPFGLDEAWLDVSGCTLLQGQNRGDRAKGFHQNPHDHFQYGQQIADQISQCVKQELGLTVSIGVSWNKVFAKFGSDYKKPNAITLITPDNYRDLVWSAPVSTLLYVGRATQRKLNTLGIYTIGDLARADTALVQGCLGKMGITLQTFARGQDSTPLRPLNPERLRADHDVKSVGSGLTTAHDICDEHEARMLIHILSQSVAQRLREQGLRARTVCIQVRDQTDLARYVRQQTLPAPSNITSEIANAAIALLLQNESLDGSRPLRSLTVRATNLISVLEPLQLDIFGDESKRQEMERLDASIDALRRRFGNKCVRRGVELGDEKLKRPER